jgi:hypothetical protein
VWFKMVQRGDFKIELVYADTKLPFIEHTKDEKIYVEVEPDIDYFISIQQTGTGRGAHTLLKIIVDEQDLGYQYPNLKRKAEPMYCGLLTKEKGLQNMKALKFTKPKISQNGTNIKRGLLMGKVEIKMYEGVIQGYQGPRDFSSSFAASAVDLNQSGLAKKKSLRSGEGETVESMKAATKQAIWKRGALLDTATLNYCAALGLMEVGVLEKPDAWTYQRMKRPAKPDQGAPRVKPKIIADPATANPQTVELFDLSAVGSDDEN